MATYKTPGVYVEEIPTFPPSVADVATAVPAFIGYTEKGPAGVATRLTSMVEFTRLFGGPPATPFTAAVAADGSATVTSPLDQNLPKFLLAYGLTHYFSNGGGPCYVVSVGAYPADGVKAADLITGLGAVEKEDEPTLIVITDAVALKVTDVTDLYAKALAQCAKLQNRFAIFDVSTAEKAVDAFRQGIGINNLKYGAAYYPYLQTTLPLAYDEGGVTVNYLPMTYQSTDPNGFRVLYGGSEVAPKVTFAQTTGAIDFQVAGGTLKVLNTTGDTTGKNLADAWTAWVAKNSAGGFALSALNDGTAKVVPVTDTPLAAQSGPLGTLKDKQTRVYNLVKTALADQRAVLPPSSAVAGIYAAVDRERGVWKAPANVSVASVIGPTVKVTQETQDDLNVDPTNGKSINAIRSFAGKGTLVWGARTLAGNDNEWRYVNVRRLFNMIEDATRKATAFAVFESNDATTWLKVKGMIESYLYGLWEQGALAGPTPQAAYFVNVGLGKTMSAQDVLEGRMIVEIGVAAVRPAEFILIRFSHKLQEA